MTLPVTGERVLVTGAGRGLGRAVVLALASRGAHLWICARTESELADTQQAALVATGRAATLRSHCLDLSKSDAVLSVADRVLSESGGIDVLINNAGRFKPQSIEALEPCDWERTLSVNLTAPYLLTRALLPHMRRQGGSVVNVSSRAGVMGFSHEADYCTSKFGLEGLTRALAVELETEPVSINTVTPGLQIKPTSLTSAQAGLRPEMERSLWNDPMKLTPAFEVLSRLRGEVSGKRFDAYRLSEAIRLEGQELIPDRLQELAE